MTRKRIEALKMYAGFLTAAMAFVVFKDLMFAFTGKDMLEIVVVFFGFICGPAFAVPFLIAGEDPQPVRKKVRR